MRWMGFGVILGLLGLSGCRVQYPSDATFACNTTKDCGGDGFICVTEGRRRGLCCKASEEVCDGKDNDCNGAVDDVAPLTCYSGPESTQGKGLCRAGTQTCANGQLSACSQEVTPLAEQCNGLDDDCDGLVDEDFDFQTNEQHCGGCAKPCEVDFKCENAACTTAIERQCNDSVDDDGDASIDCSDDDCEGKNCGAGCTCRNLQRGEGLCADGVDNDNDGLIDCSDSDCNGESCGAGCQCQGGAKAESNCSDGLDNDGDGPFDCLDAECNQASCGAGCVCQNAQKKETDCRDTVDNDADGQFDCIDTDCPGQLCKPVPNTYVCNMTGQCVCNGLVSLPLESGTQCTDGQDNDCNGKVDCQEVSCNNQSCGSGCLCALGARTEVVCDDFVDNDGDGAVDCADVAQCPAGASCKLISNAQEVAGTCQIDRSCQ